MSSKFLSFIRGERETSPTGGVSESQLHISAQAYTRQVRLAQEVGLKRNLYSSSREFYHAVDIAVQEKVISTQRLGNASVKVENVPHQNGYETRIVSQSGNGGYVHVQRGNTPEQNDRLSAEYAREIGRKKEPSAARYALEVIKNAVFGGPYENITGNKRATPLRQETVTYKAAQKLDSARIEQVGGVVEGATRRAYEAGYDDIYISTPPPPQTVAEIEKTINGFDDDKNFHFRWGMRTPFSDLKDTTAFHGYDDKLNFTPPTPGRIEAVLGSEANNCSIGEYEYYRQQTQTQSNPVTIEVTPGFFGKLFGGK